MNGLNSLSKAQLREMIAAQEKKIAALTHENFSLKHDMEASAGHQDGALSLRQIIALIPGMVFWKNKEGTYLGCNNNLARFLGLTSPTDIIGKTNHDLMGNGLADPLTETDKEIMKTGKERQVEETGIPFNTDAETIFFSQKIPLRNQQNQVIGLLGIAVDITERKRIEKKLELAKQKAEASNKAKSEFLAMVNHELRTPLTGILGLIEILKENHLPDEEIKKTIADLENCASYLLSLVNNVLDFSKLEAEKKSVNDSPVHLPDIITEITSMVSALIKNKGLALHVHIDKNIPDLVLTDPLALNQILINIVNNAVKFTDQGQITIALRCLQQTSSHAQIEIAIHDTGRGIPDDKRQLIFNPFYQLDDIYIRSVSRAGTGLGLAIAKQLATLLKIDIHIESKLGEGSSFYLTSNYQIYGTPSLNSPTIHCKERNQDASIKTNKANILLVEDDKIVQYVHSKLLEKYGHQVDVANNGHAALEILGNHDLVFVDIGLPDINGFELIRLIREVNKDIPIIALTGYTGEKEKSASLAAGANEIITKPISIHHLKKLVARYLHR